MNIETLKNEIIEWFAETKDTSLLETIKSIKDSKVTSKDWYDDLTGEQTASINRGIRDHVKGEVLTSEEFWSGHEDWKECSITSKIWDVVGENATAAPAMEDYFPEYKKRKFHVK